VRRASQRKAAARAAPPHSLPAAPVDHSPVRKSPPASPDSLSCLEAEEEAARVLDLVAHVDEEGDGLAAVDEAVVLRQRELHDGADLDLALQDLEEGRG
jgi:hypothetical protein